MMRKGAHLVDYPVDGGWGRIDFVDLVDRAVNWSGFLDLLYEVEPEPGAVIVFLDYVPSLSPLERRRTLGQVAKDGGFTLAQARKCIRKMRIRLCHPSRLAAILEAIGVAHRIRTPG